MVVPDESLATALNAKLVGSGSETFVLAHGFGGDQTVWDKILSPLSQYFQVLVFDWPFSGAIKDPNLYDPVKYSLYDAFANDLISILDEMSLESTIFVGHSMSGLIGCIASTKRPELFKRLVLVGASPRYVNTDDYEGGFEKSDIEQIISSIQTDYLNWAPNFASRAMDANDPVSLEKFVNCLKRMRPEVALSLAKTVFDSDEREVLEKVTTPCTIIQTSNDVVVPNSVAFYMQKKIKGKSTVEMINTSGHYPHLTAHLELLDVLGAVLGFSSKN